MPKMKRDDLENSFDLNLLKILLERSCCSIGHSDKTSVLDKVFKISVALGHENTGELLECWLLNAEKCMNLLMNVSGAPSALGLSLPFGFDNYAAFC
jgi:hypothetical protein